MNWRVVVLMLLAVAPITAMAQYTGGEGDGYASAAVEITSVQRTEVESSALLAPNPIKSGQPVALFGLPQQNPIRIVDALGRTCWVGQTQAQRTSIPTAGLAPGLYLVVAAHTTLRLQVIQ